MQNNSILRIKHSTLAMDGIKTMYEWYLNNYKGAK